MVNFDHKFKTRNEDEVTIVKAVEEASVILSNMLKVEGVTVRIERMNGWASTDARHAGKWTPSKSQVKVNIRNLYGSPLSTIIEVLGHEFRHVVQTRHNVMDKGIENSIKPRYLRESYWNSDIEKDARKYQKIYRDFVFNEPDFKYGKNVSTGDKVQIPLHKESKVASGFDSGDSVLHLWKPKDETQDYVVGLSDFNTHFKKKYKRWTPSAIKFYTKNRMGAKDLKREWVEVTRDATIDDLVC